MRLHTFGKLNVITWPILVGALVLASCGSDTATGATASTIDLDTEATNYIVKDPVTTTSAPAVAEEGAVVDGSQTYTVVSGDYPLKVAEQFGVPLEDLLRFNGWASVKEFPFPGQDVMIPPGAKTPAAAATEPPVSVAADAAPADPAVTPETSAASDAEAIPDAGDNCQAGSYVVAEGDYLGKVAKKFDITVEAMAAANSGTKGYDAFYPGLKIVIPAKADC